nr:immunoglobulin light chain junction region [Macaca mulatta]
DYYCQSYDTTLSTYIF